MSKAHKGSQLVLKNQTLSVPFHSTHFNFQLDALGIHFGNLIYPSTNSIYTMCKHEGIFGRSIAVEEGTINLASNLTDMMGRSDKRPFSAIPHSLGEDVTGQEGVPEAPVQGMNVWKITDTDPNNNSRVSASNLIIESDLNGYDKTYTASIWIWIPSETTVSYVQTTAYQNSKGVDWHSTRGYNSTYNYYGAGSIVEGTMLADPSIRNQWQQMSVTFTPTSSNINPTGDAEENNDQAAVSFKINPEDNDYYYVAALQIEEKNYSTSFVDGERDNGLLVYDKNIINPDQGAISFWMYAKGDHTNMYPVFSSGVDSNIGAFDFLIEKDEVPYVRVYESEGSSSTQLRPDIHLFDNWNHIAITWKQNEYYRFYGNGELLAESNTPVNWKQGYIQMATGFYIGSGIRSNPNIKISELRIDQMEVEQEEIESWYVSRSPFVNPYHYRSYAY
ncbi:phage head spike fiber domain-containing protein [Chengkuizengella axinellae]|uniref:LamG-like jellyroll fold domain-containing protein n=1 Tax=Chengkuizengella axinellae TaxID=3064388 RepID=A0ABT9IWG3_9BACL|nr:LamG-like jellyroll fold domain-containing protein [Chengkuizengella sp. 2205SS18-9]MDP5273682.1 LamG-like jellyroll fold domain-containing protein [Chengkuizengella sp. 2205SS18-9]